MRRRAGSVAPPTDCSLDEALRWLTGHGVTLDELNAYWLAHEDFAAEPDPRLAVS